MSALIKGMATVAGIVAAAGAGLWAGQTGVIKLPLPASMVATETPPPKATGPLIYYRDPSGKPLYALTPKSTDDGQPYVAVHASEDVSFDKAKAKFEPKSSERKVKFYRNPMGLPDTSPTPKKDAMGMDYIPIFEDEGGDGSSVKVSPGKIQRTGVETVTVGKHAISRTIKAPGVVQLDERRIVIVSPRFDGYVETVGPVTTGTHVKKGDILAKVFGQEVLNEAARLLIEQNSSSARGDEAITPSGPKSPSGAVVGATRRLQNLGVPDEFMQRVKHERRVPDTLEYRSRIDGEVIERNWSDGQGFKAGDVAFKIADHSLVWMMADVAEGDIAAVRTGQKVTVTTRSHPGRTFSGAVAVVYPHLMKETRTVRVRIELPNPDLALLPDMYGDVEIATGVDQDVIAVPSSAIIDSGGRQVVLLDLGEGRFEPREIKAGRRGDHFVEVVSGVAEGNKVVVNGNFLIDAESNLQSALKGLTAPTTTDGSQ
jgi:membrane fusion protein, copper/silver efflux system